MSFWRKMLWFPLSEKESSKKSTRIATLLFFVLIVLIIMSTVVTDEGIYETREAAIRSSAIATLRALVSLQEQFLEEDWDGDGKKDYAQNIDELLSSDEIAEYKLDKDWLAKHSTHYRFTISGTDGDGEHWCARASPIVPDNAEYPHYYIDETCEIRVEHGKPATRESPVGYR